MISEKNNKSSIKFLAVFIAFFLVIGCIWASVPQVEVFAQTNEERLVELQKELEEVRKVIQQYNNDIKSGKNAATAAQQRKIALEQEAAIIEEQVMLKVDEMSNQKIQIGQKSIEIAAKQQEFDTNEKLFRERLVAIYKMNNSSILSTFFAVNSFSDVLSVSKSLERISRNDTDLLTFLTEQRISLDLAKQEMETLLRQLEAEETALRAKLAEYKASIEEQSAKYSQAMLQVAEDEANLEDAQRELDQMQSELEEVWKSLGGSSGAYIGGALSWPVPTYNGPGFISSYYGWRTIFGASNFHSGIDIAGGGIYGAEIKAANAGTVIYVQGNSNTGYGNYVIVDHGGGIRTLYAHCSSVIVSVGSVVSTSTTIALVGSTGRSTGPHLHFEVRINNTEKQDPLPYLNGTKSL